MSAEKVVATIEMPNNHQGILLLERKYSLALCPALLLLSRPMISVAVKNPIIIIQSVRASTIRIDLGANKLK